MVTMEKSLEGLYKQGLIDKETYDLNTIEGWI